jgi:UrcA family protein
MPEEQRRLGTSTITTSSTPPAPGNNADLDLTRTADVGVLESRIADAAKSVCEALAKEVPFGEPRTSTCVREAQDDAQKQVKLLVDKAVGS